jgi:hypothetical protein
MRTQAPGHPAHKTPEPLKPAGHWTHLAKSPVPGKTRSSCTVSWKQGLANSSLRQVFLRPAISWAQLLQGPGALWAQLLSEPRGFLELMSWIHGLNYFLTWLLPECSYTFANVYL